MNSKGNPILVEMAGQLPQASTLYQLVMTTVDYSTIINQAKEDFYSFADPHNDTNSATLKKNGNGDWLVDMEEEDRLRMCGVLQMLADLSQELSEE
jgi:hypothetical protein